MINVGVPLGLQTAKFRCLVVARKRGLANGVALDRCRLFYIEGPVARIDLLTGIMCLWIGEVTGTGGEGGVDGEAYDMVISVEIELPKLEIGYVQGRNPVTVAQELIDKHVLDQSYLHEIADYITQRVGEYRPPVLENNGSVNSVRSGTGSTSLL